MLTQDQIEKLELYHRGKLSETESKELEKTVLENPDLKEEAEGLLDLFKGFNAIQLEKFNNDVKEWEKESALAKKKGAKVVSLTSFLSSYRLAAVAVILLLMLPLGYYLFQNLGSSNSENLYAANIEHYTAIQLNTRSFTGDDTDPLVSVKEKGINFYNEKKYDQALKHLKDYYNNSDKLHKTSEIELYLALSYLFTGNTKEAITFFSDIISKENSGNYREAAEWYLALAYLKEMNAQKTTELLKKISETENHQYQTKAKILLPEIKALK